MIGEPEEKDGGKRKGETGDDKDTGNSIDKERVGRIGREVRYLHAHDFQTREHQKEEHWV